MAGRGTDIILGGNSDYMARLKIREYLMPQIVMPEDSKLIESTRINNSIFCYCFSFNKILNTKKVFIKK